MKFNRLKKLWHQKNGLSNTAICARFYYYNLKMLRSSIKPAVLTKCLPFLPDTQNNLIKIETNSACTNFDTIISKNTIRLAFKQIGKTADLIMIQVNNYVLTKTVFEQTLGFDKNILHISVLFKTRIYHIFFLKLLYINYFTCLTLLNCIKKTKIHA